MKQGDKKISRWHILMGGYIAFLLVSATFARQLLDKMRHLVGESDVEKIPWILFGTFLLFLLWLLIKHRKRKTWVLMSLLPAAAVFLFLKGMQNPDERIHIFQYGLLGAMMMYDRRQETLKKSLGVTLALVFLTACADELFQAFLPYRVGDPRDIGFGLAGGAWGALQLWCLIHIPAFRGSSSLSGDITGVKPPLSHGS